MSTDVVLASESGIEQASDPAVYVELALARAKSWIADALEHGDIDSIVEIKSQAEAIRAYTAQKNLGKDVELSALEIMRRAERGIGLAIRKGQEAGEVRLRGERSVVVNQFGPAGASSGATKSSPTEFFQHNVEREQTYQMTDGVSDERFAEALAEAKAEGNLSRANVVRKVKGEPAPKAHRPEHLRGTPHLNSARIVGETVNSVYYAALQPDLFAQVQYGQLDSDNLREWINSLSESIRALGSLKRTLEKELNQR